MTDESKRNAETQKDESNSRTPREARTHRPSDTWVPPSTLPVPNPVDGWTFRWIRTSLFDKADLKNVSRRQREGWQPVNASEHRELLVMNDMDSRFPDCVEQGGLLLCKMPTAMVKQREEYFSKMSDQQVEAVDDHYMRENNSRMSKFSDKKTRTSFGSS